MARSEANSALRQDCVGILAGSGRLPEIVASELAKQGSAVFVVALTPETGNWVKAHPRAYVPVTHLSRLVRELKSASVKTLVLAGGIRVRPTPFSFRLDWMTIRAFPRLFRALRKGDDGLLRTAVAWLGEQGFDVVGAQDLVPSLLAPERVLTLLAPDADDQIDIHAAIAEAVRLGAADIGQAAVARSGAVAASETREGTQAMLLRVARTTHGFQRSGVLAKFSKPGQELRADMPTIGPDTVEQAAAAGLAGIVVEADRSLILDREMVVARANELGIFVAGMRGSVA
jgi:UDP-2,3-diacylglucosamine hydrolase